MKVDLITTSGLTANDGSVVASGATVKFDSEFLAARTDIRIMPKLYRNRELFEAGYSHIEISQEIIPYDFMLEIPEEEYYVLTPALLYQKVCDYLNTLIPNMFEIKITN